MLRKVLIGLLVLIALFLVMPGMTLVVRAQGQQTIELPSLNVMALVVSFVLYIALREYTIYQRDKQHFNLLASLADSLKSGLDNQTTLTAVQGATANVPPAAITDIIAALVAARIIVPTFGPLDDQFRRMLPPEKDTPPSGGTSVTATTGEAGSATNPPASIQAQIPQQ